MELQHLWLFWMCMKLYDWKLRIVSFFDNLPALFTAHCFPSLCSSVRVLQIKVQTIVPWHLQISDLFLLKKRLFQVFSRFWIEPGLLFNLICAVLCILFVKFLLNVSIMVLTVFIYAVWVFQIHTNITVALVENTFCCMSLSLSLKLHCMFYYAFTWMKSLEHQVLFTF